MANIGDLVATAQLDITPFMNNTNQLKTYMKGLDNSLKTVEKSFKGQGDKLSGLKAIYSQTGHSLTAYQAQLKKQSDHYNKLKAEIGDVNNATSEQKSQLVGAQSAMTATAAKVAELQNKYNALGREIATQSSVFTKFGTAATEIGTKMQTAGKAMTGVGEAMTKGLTVPIVAGAGIAIKAAIDFESAFAGVKKTVDETATTSYANLSRGIRDMAKELPASASEIANVAEAAGQLGIKADDVLSFTRTMIDLGESTNLSATDAAMAIAKVGNITGLAAEDYQRFGSSVVALGNNFATTESDIVMMTNRLAAAGKLAGLTNQEVLALATAMSSVGIEAEAGGTAMTQTLTAIEKAVTSGGEKLDLFAQVAGMSADQFATKWKSKPAEALEEFIRGLGGLNDKGESTTKILDDLGLKGIRQSNMLKSLGLASDKLGEAISLSNKAWEENSALTDEASKRYETTQSQLAILKNKVTDVAIEFGGPLLGALNKGIDALEPWIDKASDLAQAFSSLDKEQQQQIIKWGLIAAAAGPALTIFGKLTTGVGGAMKAIGAFSTGIGKFSGWVTTLGGASKSMTALGTATAGATTSASGLAGAIGTLGGLPFWGILLGGVAVAALGYFAQQALDAKQRTEEWGASVSKAEAQELSAFKNKVDEANRAMSAFGTEGVEDVEAIRNAFSELTGEITKLVDENLAKDLELAKKLGLSDEEVQRIKDKASETKNTVNQMSEDVLSIYRNANEQRRQLSDEEKQIVLSAQNALIQEQLAQLKYSGKEKEAITKAMNGQIDELNTKQLAKALETTKKWIEDENKEYKERKDGLKSLFDEGKITQETYNREIEQLQAEHNMKMDAYGEKYNAIRQKMAENVKLSPEAEKAYWNVIQKEMDDLGLSYEALQQKMSGIAETASQTSSMVSQYWQGMSEEASSAVTYWNSLVLDPKTGEVKTNAQEEIQKALQAEGGWEAMQLSLKEGRMTTTAKLAVGEALIATGQWESLSPSEKSLVTNNKPAMEAILESKTALEQWNALPENVKSILGSNENFLNSAEGAKQALQSWDLMTPTQKALVAQNLTGPDVALAQQSVDSLMGKTVGLDANDNTTLSKATAQSTINSLEGKTVDLNAINQTLLPKTDAQNTMDSLVDVSRDLNAVDQTAGPKAQAQSSINSLEGKTVDLNARDNGSSVVSGFLGMLSSIPSFVTTTIQTIKETIFRNEKGTNFHPGGLAMVNDQKGSTYRELVTLPTGESFIPEGRDVILPLPRGSKVLKASKTKQLFPHYANGIGFNDTNISDLTQRMGNIQRVETVVNQPQENTDVTILLKAILEELKRTSHSRVSLDINGELTYGNVDYQHIAEVTGRLIAQELQRKNQLKGGYA